MPSQPQSSTGWEEKESVSRTMLYKKITKPLLERQRRARINRCLDELKELMSAALAAEGENLTKLEKADVLELTVRHLHQLHREGELTLAAAASGLFGTPLHPRSGFQAVTSGTASAMDRRRYQGGFLACAQQVASYVMKTPGLEPGLGQRLLAHLARCAQQLSDPNANLIPGIPGQSTSGSPLSLPGIESPNSSIPFPLSHLINHSTNLSAPQAPSSTNLDPSLFNATMPREYSITAQFQVYRNSMKQDVQMPGHFVSLEKLPDVRELQKGVSTKEQIEEPVQPVTSALKRSAPTLIESDFPKIPKKRYCHFNFDGDVSTLSSRTQSNSHSPSGSQITSDSTIQTQPVDLLDHKSLSPRPKEMTDLASSSIAKPCPLRILEPIACTSTSNFSPSGDFYVVESRIVELSPRLTSRVDVDSRSDCKDNEPMWRPW